MTRRISVPWAAFLAASAWCVALVVFRKLAAGVAEYPNLIWDLFLAWTPLLFAVLLAASYTRRRSAIELGAVGLAWLLFLPNAPYLVTDFIYVGGAHRVYDALLVGSFATTGLALGFVSLLLVQNVVTQARGARLGWAVAFGALFSASIGVYLGRVLRFNSWDAIQQPHRIWDVVQRRMADPLGNPELIAFVIAFCIFLALVYVGLYRVASPALSPSRGER
jgi:uncharacterized membrane protein